MMRITVDTNVLISATLTYGACEKIIDLAEQKNIILCLSEPILKEYYKVMYYPEIQEKIKGKLQEVQQAITKIATIAHLTAVQTHLKLIKEDPDDDKIVECAIDSHSEYLISSDNHILNYKKQIRDNYKITVLTPQEFLTIITIQQQE